MNRKGNFSVFLKLRAQGFSVFVILVDQFSKNLAEGKLDIVCNRKTSFGLEIFSFGLLNNSNLIFLSFLILIFVYFLFAWEREKLIILYLALILGGGVSNLIDRVTAGCVRDFIDISAFPFLTWFPKFNFADVAITIGVLGILYSVLENVISKRGK